MPTLQTMLATATDNVPNLAILNGIDPTAVLDSRVVYDSFGGSINQA